MTHYSRVDKIVIDVPASTHDRELAFWQNATGGETGHSERNPEFHWAGLPGQAIAMLVQRLGEGPGRLHLDIHTDDLDAEVARLEALGAERIRQVHTWWIMRSGRPAVLRGVGPTGPAQRRQRPALGLRSGGTTGTSPARRPWRHP